MHTCSAGRREGGIQKPLPWETSLSVEPVTETAPLVLAQRMVGEWSAWAQVSMGQCSAQMTRVSTPSFRQGRVMLLQLLHQNQGLQGQILLGLAPKVYLYELWSKRIGFESKISDSIDFTVGLSQSLTFPLHKTKIVLGLS